MAAATYRITVRGGISERFSAGFDGMSVEPGPGETTLVGELTDQVQLHGLLDHIRDFGLELVRMERSESG